MYIVLKILQIFLCRHSVDRSHGDFEMIKYISDMSRCIWQRAKKKPPHARLYALLLLYSRQKKKNRHSRFVFHLSESCFFIVSKASEA